MADNPRWEPGDIKGSDQFGAPSDQGVAYSIIDHDRGAIVSSLAYAANVRKGQDPKVAVQAALDEQKRQAESFQYSGKASADEQKRAMSAQNFLSDSSVVDATQDFIAIRKGKELYFGMRGTSGLRDLVTDAQLAMNAKNIPRLNQAREFVKKVRAANPDIAASGVVLTGHSLGGFLAEGVQNDIAGARAITFQSASPLLGRKSSEARAFNKRNGKFYPATRFVREGDLVPAGAKKLNPSAQQLSIKSVKRGLGGLLQNHKLANSLPWMANPQKAVWEKPETPRPRLMQRIRANLQTSGKRVGGFFGGLRRRLGFGGNSSAPGSPARRVRTPTEQLALQARWNQRQMQRARGSSSTAPVRRVRRARTPAERASIQARWNQRKLQRPAGKPGPLRSVRRAPPPRSRT